MVFFKNLKKMRVDREKSIEETKLLTARAEDDLQKAIDLENRSRALIKKMDEKLEVNHFAERYLKALGG